MASKKSGKSPKQTPSGKSRTPSSSRAPAPAPRKSRRDDVEFSSEEEFLAVDDPAAAMLENAVKQTPWWAISLAVHGLVLAALPLIIFSKALLEGPMSGATVIKMRAQKVTIPEVASDQHGVIENSLPSDPTATSSELPNVEMPNAIDGDHIETANEKDTHTAFGDSLDAHSWFPGESTGLKGRDPNGPPGNNTSIGIGLGNGSSGRYGTRTGGGRVNMIVRGGGNPIVCEEAVKSGLRWLARHQAADGHWDALGFMQGCKNGGHCEGPGHAEFDTGVTGLALLAFLGAGYTPQNRTAVIDPVTGQPLHFGECVRKGCEWLVSQQRPDGSIGPGVGEMMYNHAIATLALTEAYGTTNAVVYRNPAQKAINFIHTAQNYNLGWRYTPKCGDNDTSVTGWCVMALKSAQISGLEVAQSSYEGARAWIDRVTEKSTGEVGYNKLGSGEIFVPGKNEKWSHHPSMTAVGMLCRIFIDKKQSDPVLPKSAKVLTDDLPKYDPHASRPTVDYYYWYYASLALFQYDGPDGQHWKKWNKAMLAALCPTQHTRRDGCLEGSWDTSETDRWGYAGGRVYATAINVLTLEVYYRYKSVFGVR